MCTSSRGQVWRFRSRWHRVWQLHKGKAQPMACILPVDFFQISEGSISLSLFFEHHFSGSPRTISPSSANDVAASAILQALRLSRLSFSVSKATQMAPAWPTRNGSQQPKGREVVHWHAVLSFAKQVCSRWLCLSSQKLRPAPFLCGLASQ